MPASESPSPVLRFQAGTSSHDFKLFPRAAGGLNPKYCRHTDKRKSVIVVQICVGWNWRGAQELDFQRTLNFVLAVLHWTVHWLPIALRNCFRLVVSGHIQLKLVSCFSKLEIDLVMRSEESNTRHLWIWSAQRRCYVTSRCSLDGRRDQQNKLL